MGILDRYLARAIIMSTFLVLLIILSLDAFFSFLGESKHMARYPGYTHWHALVYLCLQIPRKITEFLPAVTMIGSLVGLGLLASNNELVALRASGMSKARVIAGAMKTGVAIAVFMFLLNEYVVPHSASMATVFKARAQGKSVTTQLRQYWTKNGNEFIYIGEAKPEYRLTDIKLFAFQDDSLVSATQIEHAKWQDGVWHLSEIKTDTYHEDRIETQRQASSQRQELIETNLFKVATVKPEHMSLAELNQYINYLNINNMGQPLYVQAFWSKITGLISIWVMMFLAMPFAFNQRRAGNTGSRILIGIMMGLTFFICSGLFNNFAQIYGLSPVVGAFAPIILFTAFGFWLLHWLQK